MNTRRSIHLASNEAPLSVPEAQPQVDLFESSVANSAATSAIDSVANFSSSSAISDDSDPVPALLASIRDAKASWVSAVQQLKVVLLADEPDEAAASALRVRIANCSSIVSESEKLLAVLDSSVGPAASVAPISSGKVSTLPIPMHPIAFPSNLPQLKAGSTRGIPFDVYEFIDVFEGILRGSLVPEHYWTAALINCVPATDTESISFLNKSVCHLTWPEAKPVVLKHFSSVDLVRHYNQQFSAIRCAPDESASRFSSRFLNLVSKAKKDPDCATTRDTFLAALPVHLQKQLKIKAVELDTLSELISFAVRFESLEEALLYHSERSKPAKQPEEITCNYCRKPGHMIVNCPKKAAKASVAFASSMLWFLRSTTSLSTWNFS